MKKKKWPMLVAAIIVIIVIAAVAGEKMMNRKSFIGWTGTGNRKDGKYGNTEPEVCSR